MRDTFENQLDLLYPATAEKLGKFKARIDAEVAPCRMTQGLRSLKQQVAIFAQGRTLPGKIVTGTSFSMHSLGLAGDFCFLGAIPYPEITNPSWVKFGDIARECGLVWGGTFPRKDGPHVQDTYGLEKDLLELLYKQGGIQAVWSKLDQVRGVKIGTWAARLTNVKTFLES